MDDAWEPPRPAIGRQDVLLAVSVEVVSLLALELVRSSGGLEHTDVAAWVQWLAVSTGAALLSGVAWARDRRAMAIVVSTIVLFMFAWITWQFALGSTVQEWLDDEEFTGRTGASRRSRQRSPSPC